MDVIMWAEKGPGGLNLTQELWATEKICEWEKWPSPGKKAPNGCSVPKGQP